MYQPTIHSFIYVTMNGVSPITCYVLCPSLGCKTKQTQLCPITTSHSPPPKLRSGGKCHYTDNTNMINFQKVIVLDAIGAYNKMT